MWEGLRYAGSLRLRFRGPAGVPYGANTGRAPLPGLQRPAAGGDDCERAACAALPVRLHWMRVLVVEVRSPRLSVYGQLQRRVGRVLFSSMPRWRSLRHSAPRTPLRAPRVLGGIAVNRPLRPAFWLCPRGTPPGQEGVYGWDIRLGAISRNLPQSPVTLSGPGAWEKQG